MKGGRLWAPWRARYFAKPFPRACVFCRVRRGPRDRRQLVVSRGRHALAVLNLYPYNNGHLLVAPYRHAARLHQLTDPERLDLWRVAMDMMQRLDRAVAPHGYNLGMNLGRAAGAGIAGHLHLHIVPRWRGDTNFMPVTAGTKVISDSLDAMWQRLARW